MTTGSGGPSANPTGVGVLRRNQIKGMLSPEDWKQFRNRDRDEFRWHKGKLYIRGGMTGYTSPGGPAWTQLKIVKRPGQGGRAVPESAATTAARNKRLQPKPPKDKDGDGFPDLDISNENIEVDSVPYQSGRNLGAFGSPSMKRVNSILDSLMHEATKEYSRNISDLRGERRGDLMKNLRTGLAFDRGAQALNSGNMAIGAAMAQKLAPAQAMQQSARADIENRLNQTSEGISDTSAGTVSAADDNAANTQLASNISSGTQSDIGFMNAIRAASAMGGVENANALKAQYFKAIQANQRDLSDVRRRKPLTRLELEKQMWDMHIAKKLAQAEYETAGQGILSQQHSRQMDKEKLKLTKDEMAAKKAEGHEKDRETVLGILYGTKEDVKGIYRDANGNPVLDVNGKIQPMTTTQFGVGRPSSLNEAIKMLAAAGFRGKRWQNIAKEVYAEQTRQMFDTTFGYPPNLQDILYSDRQPWQQ